jgi:gamma-glutamylcyclotransferase (GGCT)/AIG2-like uncharacterized protein YtfP
MPLLFSYGTLQLADVQVSTVGRRLVGQPDTLVGFESSRVEIEDPDVVSATGWTHYANVIASDVGDQRVDGMVFEVSDAELARIDQYEADASYTRVEVTLASGRRAWVYHR